MKCKSKSVAWLAAAAFSTAGLSTANAQDTIKIGAVYAGSGNSAYYSRLVVDGVKLAVEQVNASGGLLGGKKVELLLEDDENRPDISATKVRKLIDSGVVAIMSLSGSPSSLQNYRIADAAKVPEVCVNIADALFRLKSPYLFLTSMPASVQVAAIAAYLKKNNLTRVALITDTGPIGSAVARSMRKGLPAAGITIATEQNLEKGSTSFIAQWQRIRKAKVQAVVDAVQSVGDQILFRRTYKRLGLKLPHIGTIGWSFPVFPRQLKKQVNGLLYVDMLDPQNPQFLKYKTAYEKRSKFKADVLNGSGYDTMSILLDAIKRAGKAEPEAIRKALQETEGFKGVLGAKGTSFTFAPDKRWAFPPKGAVIRVYENQRRGKVVFRGNE